MANRTYVYLGQYGRDPECVAVFETRKEADAFIKKHAVDQQGNLSCGGWNSPYLYLADAEGNTLG